MTTVTSLKSGIDPNDPYVVALALVASAADLPKLGPVCDAIIATDWDYTERRLRMEPEFVETMLNSFGVRNASFSELIEYNGKAATYIGVIFDAFCRVALQRAEAGR